MLKTMKSKTQIIAGKESQKYKMEGNSRLACPVFRMGQVESAGDRRDDKFDRYRGIYD